MGKKKKNSSCTWSHFQPPPLNRTSHITVTPYSEGLVGFHAGSPALSSEFVSYYLLEAAVSVVFPIMILISFAHMIPPLSLQLSTRSSSQCLDANNSLPPLFFLFSQGVNTSQYYLLFSSLNIQSNTFQLTRSTNVN